MNEFSDHIQILIWFMMALIIGFVVCFSAFFGRFQVWVSLIIAVVFVVMVIAILARCGSEID